MVLSQRKIPARAGIKVNFPNRGVTALTLALDSKNSRSFADERAVRRAMVRCSRLIACRGDGLEKFGGKWFVNLRLRLSALPVLVSRLSFSRASVL